MTFGKSFFNKRTGKYETTELGGEAQRTTGKQIGDRDYRRDYDYLLFARDEIPGHPVLGILRAYKEEARIALEETGYAGTLHHLLPFPHKELFPPGIQEQDEERIYNIANTYISILRAEESIAKGDIEGAVLGALIVGYSAVLARIRPIEPHIDRGRKVLESARLGGKATKEQRTDDAQDRHDKWRADADEIWTKNPRLSRLRVAGILAERYAMDPLYQAKTDTIYRVIKK